MHIRHAHPHHDADAIASIYEPFVLETAVTFDELPPTPRQFAEHIARLQETHVYLVAEDERGVAGYAYGSPHRERPAYRWSTEVSIYLHERSRGRGLGRRLYEELFTQLVRRGYWLALSGITLPNPASEALHAACGFEPIGVYRAVGWKAGEWQDVVWLQKRLREDDGPPAELV